MMMTMPSGAYGGLPPVRFGPPNSFRNRSHHTGYGKQPGVHPPFYQPPFNAPAAYPTSHFNQARRSGLGTQLGVALTRLDQQYRQERYMRSLGKQQGQFLRNQARNDLALTTYPMAGGAGAWNQTTGDVVHYEQEIRYVPFPVYIPSGSGGRGNLGYGRMPTIGFGGSFTAPLQTQMNMNLPPKIRVIFIPTGNSSLQQSWTGPLAMPPFLFNRMSQPLCSFALPPPLPQLGSLPLTPVIQQMVMQRYENPVAVFPFSPNWQVPQPMISNFSQISQQQSMMPMSSFQPIFAPPPSYLPPAPFPMPIAPQAYLPPPLPMPAAAPSYAMPPDPSISFLPPPPAFSGYGAPPQALHYSNNGYPDICRACPPAPPSLGIPVQGHCWVQHCSACHHVPATMAPPNIRPNGGRVTPLLRYPTVPQYVPEQTMQWQSDPHADAPVMMRPWLRKTPPLPPGAVIISDQYFFRNPTPQRHRSSRRPVKVYSRQSSRRHRSSTVATTPTVAPSQVTERSTRRKSPVSQNQKNNSNPSRQQAPARGKSVSTASSIDGSASSKSVEYKKTTFYPAESEEKVIPKELAGEARNVNMQFNYQAQELPSVYLINRYIKSSSEASSLASHLSRSPASTDSSDSKDSSSIDEEKSASSPLPSKSVHNKRIVIRESVTRSPSIASSFLSDTVFSVLGKDVDAMSTTSTLKANLEEDGIVDEAVF